MPSFTDAPSGTGVIASLALDQAPFTRMTSVGTFVCESVVLEKSPPSTGTVAPRWFCPKASNDVDKARTYSKHGSPKRIIFVPLCNLQNVLPAAITLQTVNSKAGETAPSPASACHKAVTASAGSSTSPAVG